MAKPRRKVVRKLRKSSAEHAHPEIQRLLEHKAEMRRAAAADIDTDLSDVDGHNDTSGEDELESHSNNFHRCTDRKNEKYSVLEDIDFIVPPNSVYIKCRMWPDDVPEDYHEDFNRGLECGNGSMVHPVSIHPVSITEYILEFEVESIIDVYTTTRLLSYSRIEWDVLPVPPDASALHDAIVNEAQWQNMYQWKDEDLDDDDAPDWDTGIVVGSLVPGLTERDFSRPVDPRAFQQALQYDPTVLQILEGKP